jgi:DNA primase
MFVRFETIIRCSKSRFYLGIFRTGTNALAGLDPLPDCFEDPKICTDAYGNYAELDLAKGIKNGLDVGTSGGDQLMIQADAGPARGYLRSRGIDGDSVRAFRLGWAPDAWDELVRHAGIAATDLRETGLAHVSKRQSLIDAFRNRVLFPIFTESGDPVAFGGRVLPGSADPAKYKNSPETPIYAKSKTLYGLNWAKSDVVAADQVVVCEGYTDVIGFHRAGVPRAVATCGTALTEEHVRLLTRFAKRVVLAFDADAAGQAAADRFYEWEAKYQMAVSVLQLPKGADPADMARTDPTGLRDAVGSALPFLGFRLQRILRAHAANTPESRARVAEQAMAVVNEHPNPNVRTIYAGEVAAHCGLPVADLVKMAQRRTSRVPVQAVRPAMTRRESGEVVALALLAHRWDEIAELLVEPLFADPVNLAAFRALAATGDVNKAIEVADPDARELLEEIAVKDIEADPVPEAYNLIGAATRRLSDELRRDGDISVGAELAEAKRRTELLDDPARGTESADWLLSWMLRRTEERG